MNLMQYMNAYAAVMELMKKECDYTTAYALVTVKRHLKPHADFFLTEEMKLVEEYAARDEHGKICWTERGTFPFQKPELAMEYVKRHEELGLIQVHEDFTAIPAPMPERITPEQLEALDGFIRFGEGVKV